MPERRRWRGFFRGAVIGCSDGVGEREKHSHVKEKESLNIHLYSLVQLQYLQTVLGSNNGKQVMKSPM